MLLATLLEGTLGDRLTDEALMERVVQRDAQALEQLYERHSRTVYSVLLRMTEQPASADELLQDVFLRLWNNASSYQATHGPLTPWLLTLARNIAVDRLRSKGERQRRQEYGMELPPEEAKNARIDEWVDQRRLAAEVRQRMARLSDAQRQALDLAYYKGLSHSEIASRLGEPLGTVKTWIRSAVLQLREEMGEET
ncbi:MAG: sigma-70 family RNA polymerase sigma factor [Acidobacteria bacterium]|nr:sigma-70 family RNA polymerase sigma factor [Acidobacteriota bacterium]